MKIIQLKSENFKKIKAIEITPGDKSTIVISGKNGQGKSSILDSIFVALGGKPSDLTKPIREGEERATIEVELTDYFVTRTFKQGSSKLEVVGKLTGEVMKSPQALLDKIIGTLAFDPLEFQNMKATEQRATLLKLTNLDLDSFAKKRESLYTERHDEGVAMNQYPELTFPEIAEAERIIATGKIDITALSNEITEATKKEGATKENQRQVAEISQKIADINNEIKALELRRSALVEELQKAFIIESALKAQPKLDIEAAQKKINEAENINAVYVKAEMALKQHEDRKKIKVRWEELSKKIDELDAERNSKLQQAKMPIDGLSVTDDNVTYKNIPFSQLSSAEKLKISMSIAMAMKPELRVIRIADGSLLDDDNMNVIKEMAGDKDFQVWIEKVDSSGKVGIYIEEGEIKAINE